MHRKFSQSLKNAIDGLAHMITKQRNFEIQIVFAIIVLSLSIILPLTVTEWFYVTMAIAAVLMAEMLNTVTEYLADLVKKEKSIHVQIIKDISASVVLISVIWAIFVGSIIFVPYII